MFNVVTINFVYSFELISPLPGQYQICFGINTYHLHLSYVECEFGQWHSSNEKKCECVSDFKVAYFSEQMRTKFFFSKYRCNYLCVCAVLVAAAVRLRCQALNDMENVLLSKPTDKQANMKMCTMISGKMSF